MKLTLVVLAFSSLIPQKCFSQDVSSEKYIIQTNLVRPLFGDFETSVLFAKNERFGIHALVRYIYANENNTPLLLTNHGYGADNHSGFAMGFQLRRLVGQPKTEYSRFTSSSPDLNVFWGPYVEQAYIDGRSMFYKQSGEKLGESKEEMFKTSVGVVLGLPIFTRQSMYSECYFGIGVFYSKYKSTLPEESHSEENLGREYVGERIITNRYTEVLPELKFGINIGFKRKKNL